MSTPTSMEDTTFRCMVCGKRYTNTFRSKTKWFTDAMFGPQGPKPKQDGVELDICMRCKSPPPNDGGSPGTPILPNAA